MKYRKKCKWNMKYRKKKKKPKFFKCFLYTSAAIVLIIIGVIFGGIGVYYLVPLSSSKHAEPRSAICEMQAGDGTATGTLALFQETMDQPILVSGDITGIPKGGHGFHIHEWGLQGGNCGSTGSPYNPKSTKHENHDSEVRHVGEHGNINAGEGDIALVQKILKKNSLWGHSSIIGRSIVLHENEDTLNPHHHEGHAGPRIACCTVTLAKHTPVGKEPIIVESRSAVCVLQAGLRVVKGSLNFVQEAKDKPVMITGDVTGIPKGRHGFHIHQWGLQGDDCGSTGSHYNPYNTKHGGPYSLVRHVGDLGNIEAVEGDLASVQKDHNSFSLWGDDSIIGRAIVVHEKPDTLNPEHPSGNAGPRIACCTITLNRKV